MEKHPLPAGGVVQLGGIVLALALALALHHHHLLLLLLPRAVDASVDLRNQKIRLITPNVLPGATGLTKDGVAVVE